MLIAADALAGVGGLDHGTRGFLLALNPRVLRQFTRENKRMTTNTQLKYLHIAASRSSAAIAGLFCCAVSIGAFAAQGTIEELKAKYGPALVLVGPVTKLDSANQPIEVMGQSIRFALDQPITTNQFVTEQRVAVTGKFSQDGSITADGIEDLGNFQADGGSEVLITGVITSTTSNLGRATVGKIQVDYTPTLWNASTFIPVGLLVEFRGIGFASNNLVVASLVRPIETKAGSMGSGRAPAGSMGSGIANPAGSMGSGSPTAITKAGSMGSGRAPAGSMGSGIASPAGSMGSGSPTAITKAGSMGSGLATSSQLTITTKIRSAMNTGK